jgi:hypothetical protein
MSKKISESNDLPHVPGSLAVTDGHETIGHIVIRDGSFFAFGIDDILIGEFDTQRKAVRALPAAKAHVNNPEISAPNELSFADRDDSTQH